MPESDPSPVRPAAAPRFPWREELKIRLWAGLAAAALWGLRVSIRPRFVGTDELFARWRRGERVILTFWHSRIVLMRFAYRGRGACIMNSRHRDGEIVTRVLRRFGIMAVRGSSSRGWVGGLKGMVAAYRRGADLIVVPDGPRGPRERAKSGALQLARRTGAPVYPTAYSAAWHCRLGSWDKLMLPFPFSRVVYVAGPPICVPQDATPEQMEEKRALLEVRLRETTARADACLGTRASSPQQGEPSRTRGRLRSRRLSLFLYNLVLTLALLVAGPIALLVVGLHPRWRVGLDQRLGRLPASVVRLTRQAQPLWLHAASVGELLAARPFLHALKTRFPDRPLLVSVQTATAREAAARQCPDIDGVFLLPLDHPLLSGLVVRRLRPAAFFFTETELWPNVLASLARRGVPTLLVSGRFSTRAQRRAARLAPLFRSVTRSVTEFCMQTAADAERLIAAGADRKRVRVTGNFKIDNTHEEGGADGAALLDAHGLGGRPLLVGASTHAPEEEILLDAAQRLRDRAPTMLLLLAPRHPQRFASVETLLKDAGCRYVKRSTLPATAPADTQVFLLDTLGELAAFHAAAALVFVGGSLVRGPGGHSVIEPALAGVPVCFGPHTHNFASAVETLVQAGGGIEVYDADGLVRAAAPLLTDACIRRATGARARAAMHRERGAVARTMDVVLRDCPVE